MTERTRTSPAQRAFVVQFRPETDPRTGRFEGRVEQVASGESASFQSLEEVVEFMARTLAEQ